MQPSYTSSYNSLKKFINVIKQRIPLNIKIVAELRLMWPSIVGETLSLRSQPAKCEYIPQKNDQGNITGEYRRRLVVHVKDSVTQSAMVFYISQYLDLLPKSYKIHSMRFVVKNSLDPKIKSEARTSTLVYNISDQEKSSIVKKVQELSFDPKTEESIIHYLITCKHVKNIQDSHESQ